MADQDTTIDWDEVLAYQLASGDLDDVPVDAFTFLEHQESNPHLPEYGYDEDHALMSAIQASLSREAPLAEMSPPAVEPSHCPSSYLSARDRYDRRGIATFSSRPRRGRNTSGRSFDIEKEITSNSSLPVSSRNSLLPFPEVSLAKLSAARFTLDPKDTLQRNDAAVSPSADHGSAPILDILGVDTLLCILDVLHFPDAFALAITCKALYAHIDLPRKKQQYGARLIKLQSDGMMGRHLPCHVWVYCLDPYTYFPYEVYNQAANEWLCRDCEEMRSRVKAGGLVDANGVHIGRLVSPVWRPSRRVVVPGTDGFLWYRERA